MASTYLASTGDTFELFLNLKPNCSLIAYLCYACMYVYKLHLIGMRMELNIPFVVTQLLRGKGQVTFRFVAGDHKAIDLVIRCDYCKCMNE